MSRSLPEEAGELVAEFRWLWPTGGFNSSSTIGPTSTPPPLRAAKPSGVDRKTRSRSAPTWPTSKRGGGCFVKRSRRGRIDLLVNNAGVAPRERSDVLETTAESWDHVLATNLRGPFFLTQAVARTMVEMSEAGTVQEPQIVFITSVSSTFASTSRAEYCVSKAGLSMVAQLFSVRLARQGVRVYEVRPGLIATAMTEPVRERYDERIAAGLTPIAGGERRRTSVKQSLRLPPARFPIRRGRSSTSTAD